MRVVREAEGRFWTPSLKIAAALVAAAVLVVPGALLWSLLRGSSHDSLPLGGGTLEWACNPGGDEVLSDVLNDLRDAVRPGDVVSTRPFSCGENSGFYGLSEVWRVENTAGAAGALRSSLLDRGWSGSDRSFTGDRDGIHILIVVNVQDDAGKYVVAGDVPGRLLVSLSEHPRS